MNEYSLRLLLIGDPSTQTPASAKRVNILSVAVLALISRRIAPLAVSSFQDARLIRAGSVGAGDAHDSWVFSINGAQLAQAQVDVISRCVQTVLCYFVQRSLAPNEISCNRSLLQQI